jgi:hypothetical protein
MHGTADHTAGGLKKGDLMMHKGRIVSRKAHAAGLKAIQRLRKSGKMAPPFTGKRTKKNGKKASRSSNTVTNRRGRLHNASSGKYLSSPKKGGFW